MSTSRNSKSILPWWVVVILIVVCTTLQGTLDRQLGSSLSGGLLAFFCFAAWIVVCAPVILFFVIRRLMVLEEMLESHANHISANTDGSR